MNRKKRKFNGDRENGIKRRTKDNSSHMVFIADIFREEVTVHE